MLQALKRLYSYTLCVLSHVASVKEVILIHTLCVNMLHFEVVLSHVASVKEVILIHTLCVKSCCKR